MVAKHVSKKNNVKPRVSAINALLLSFAALAATFTAEAFNNNAKPKWILHEFDVPHQ